MRLKPWRVRVKRVVEDWVEVLADSPASAEQQAFDLPHTVHVFKGMTVPGDKLAKDIKPQPIGVEEEDEER